MLSLPQKGSSLGSEQGGWDTQHHIFPDLKAPGLYMLFPSISGVGTMLMALHPRQHHATALFCFNNWLLLKMIPFISCFLPHLASFLIKRGHWYL